MTPEQATAILAPMTEEQAVTFAAIYGAKIFTLERLEGQILHSCNCWNCTPDVLGAFDRATKEIAAKDWLWRYLTGTDALWDSLPWDKVR